MYISLNTGGDALNELRSLAKLMNYSLKTIENCITSQNISFPGLNETYSPKSESSLGDPAVVEAAAHIVSAAAQLSAMVRPPPLTIIHTAFQVRNPSFSMDT